MLETLWQDVRFGFRMLKRNPGFSATAIFCLTLGVGANASVFSWMEGILLTAAGIALGGAASFLLTRLIANLLYHTSPHDPLAFAMAAVVMAVASLAACLIPAWRAARTDPLTALRQ